MQAISPLQIYFRFIQEEDGFPVARNTEGFRDYFCR
jgi:hypothetical protein